MKHPYALGCDCKRCAREAVRRDAQSRRDALNADNRRFYAQPVRKVRTPVPGSQEWAETRGDNLGYSGDY